MTRSPRGLLERCITEFDAALRSVVEPQASGRPRPGPDATPAGDDVLLSETERDLAARLMRVNHSGEIAAQALYRGQALVARDDALRERLLAAAREERDHLEWCAARTRELGGRVSVLAPFWYAGAATIGALAGLLGDRASLGFLAETEKQVAEHLDGHLGRLPARDLRTRDIVATMRAEELAHRSDALARGGMDVPLPGRLAMRLASRVMTTVAHWL